MEQDVGKFDDVIFDAAMYDYENELTKKAKTRHMDLMQKKYGMFGKKVKRKKKGV